MNITSKDMAFVISVSGYDAKKGYPIGIAVKNEPGYYLTTEYITEKDYGKAQEVVDERNIKIHGSLKTAWKLIATTMRAT